MKCHVCGSDNIETDYEYELRFCRGCGTIVESYGNGMFAKAAKFLDFLET